MTCAITPEELELLHAEVDELLVAPAEDVAVALAAFFTLIERRQVRRQAQLAAAVTLQERLDPVWSEAPELTVGEAAERLEDQTATMLDGLEREGRT